MLETWHMYEVLYVVLKNLRKLYFHCNFIDISIYNKNAVFFAFFCITVVFVFFELSPVKTNSDIFFQLI